MTELMKIDKSPELFSSLGDFYIIVISSRNPCDMLRVG